MRYIESYVHHNQIGVLLEIETPYHIVLQADEFQTLARDIAMHIAALNPAGIDRQTMPKAIPAALRPHDNAMDEEALMEQAWFKDPDRTVAEVIQDLSRNLQAPISVTRFVRFHIDDF